MKIGFFGLPQSGKKTLFGLLTGTSPAPQPGEILSGVADVLDARFDRLAAMYKPKKETRARIHMELLPDVDAAALRHGAVFRDIAVMDALCCVVRAFENERVYHPAGSVDPGRDCAMMLSELVLHDHLFVEKRLERIAATKNKPQGDQLKKEEELMQRMCLHLEEERPLRTMTFTTDERKLLSGYPLITLKTVIVVLNLSDSSIADDSLEKDLAARFADSDLRFMRISAMLESEIAALETESERREFMEASGIDEPAVNLLSRTCMRALGLLSFFTVGPDEVRQWQIRGGALAPEAGGAIHSDIQRGFIRAEVVKYDDLTALGSEEAVKKAGKAHVMGKDYAVEDGDIINFRFAV